MRAEREAGKSHPSKVRSYEFHEDQMRVMMASVLPDKCTSSEYVKKCDVLKNDHLPYFETVKLEQGSLSRVYLSFLPAELAGDARSIEAQMRASGDWADPEKVKREAAMRVAQAADPLSLIHISEPTRHRSIAYAVFCLRRD